MNLLFLLDIRLMSLLSLPPEIIDIIAITLPIKYANRLRHCCKLLANIININTIVRRKLIYKTDVEYDRGEFISDTYYCELEGIKHGICKTFTLNPYRLSEIKHFINGRLHGKHLILCRDGYKTSIEYNRGEIHGEYIGYRNKNITFIRNYIYDTTNGPYTYFTSLGTIHRDYTYVNGIINGLYREYHDNGKIYKCGIFNNGRRCGLWTVYHLNGNVSDRINYINGLRQGIYTTYHSTGKLASIRNYKDDKKHGQFIEYSGGKTLISLYDKGYRID